MRYGKPGKRPVGPVEPAPDPDSFADFDLGTWRVRPALGRMTRADRLVALDAATLRCLLVLHTAPPQGVSRAMLSARVFGPGAADEKLRRCLSLLRRVFAEDGSVRIEHVTGDHYCLWSGPPVPGRTLRGGDGSRLTEPVSAVSAWAERPRRWLPGLAAAIVVVALLGAGLVHVLGGLGHALKHEIRQTRAFAAEPGTKSHPSFSPDGRQVVYSWAAPDEAAAHLYVRTTAGGAPRALTQGPGDDRLPVWSPGAGLIAFVRRGAQGCELWTVLADGTGERRVGACNAEVIGPMAFSRDGRALTYPNRTSPVLASQLVSLDLNTGALGGVTNPSAGMPGDSLPALSGNARRLAFVRSRSPGVADISLVETTAGAVARVTRDQVPVTGLVWEPDSRMLLFASMRGGPSQLWALPADGGTPRFVLGGDGDIEAPAMSVDGHRIIYERVHRTAGVVTAPAERATAPQALWQPTADDRQASRSPDGRRLAFLSNRTGQDEVWVADASGKDARPLTHDLAEALDSLCWTPDGTQLVATVTDHGATDLYVYDALSGARRRLTREGAAGYAAFSGDGHRLYYSVARDGQRQIWRRSWPGLSDPVQITRDGGLVARESADGRRLYFVRPDRIGLWIRDPAPDGDEALVTAELTVTDASDWYVAPGAVYFVTRPADALPTLARYGEDTEAVRHLRVLPGLRDRSGLAPAAEADAVLYSQETHRSVDLEIAEID